jgi:hypothetical protein
VLQGGRGLDGDAADPQRLQLLQDGSAGREVVRVGAARINQACTQALVGREAVLADEGQGAVASSVTRDTTEVQADGSDWEVDSPGVGRTQVIIVGDQVNGAADGSQGLEGGLVDGLGCGAGVSGE